MKNSLIFALTIVGTIIGAGFATGQELYSFFISAGNSGSLYFFLSIFLMIAVSAVLYIYCKSEKVYSTEVLFNNLFGRKISLLYFFITTLFLFACFSVTVAGTGSMFCESLGFPYFTGVITILLITYATMQFDINGIFFVNSLITPFIIISIIILGFLSSFNQADVFSSFENIRKLSIPLFNALMYFGYNILSLLPIILSSSKTIPKASIIKGFILSFFTMIITGIVILFAMYNTSLNLEDYSLPFLKIVSDYSELSKNIYLIIMYFSMITTAISCFYGFYHNIKYVIYCNEQIIIITGLLISYITAFIGFTTLVRKVYSVFGIFGIVMSLSVIYKIFTIKRNSQSIIKK